MVRYKYTFPTGTNETDAFTKLIQVGMRTLKFDFQWAIVSEEQYSLVQNHLTSRAQADPLFIEGNFNREYDWFNYYYALRNIDISTWLDSNPILPVSIKGQPRDTQLYLINIHVEEVKALAPVINLYKDVLKWQFTMTCDTLPTTVGYVQPGGWYHNQDDSLAFRFVSELENIGKEDITKISIEFEVYDE